MQRRSKRSLADTACVCTNWLAGSITAKSFPIGQQKSISAEDTFERDLSLAEMGPMIRGLAEKVWAASRKESRIARTVVLKLKTSEFVILTRSHTPCSPPSSCEELANIALLLRERAELGLEQRLRLLGVGLSNFRESDDVQEQSGFFE